MGRADVRMLIVRRGISRTVILVGRWAVKVPSLRGGSTGPTLRGRLQSFAEGVLANASEHQWHDYEPWRGKVTPVLRSWLGGLVQVYPRCAPLPVNERDEYDGPYPLPELEPDPRDNKADNFGLLGGRVVRLDYDMR
jgi:hypothetical protein